MKSWIRLLVLCTISFFCLWLAVKGVNTRGLILSVTGADLTFLALTVTLTVGTLFIRAWRWSILLPAGGKIKFDDLLIVTGIGLAANNILPAHLGEVVRAYALHLRTGTAVSTALSTLVVERVLDLTAILAALGVVLIQLFLPEWVHRIGKVLLLTDAVIMTTLVLLNKYPETVRFIVRRSLTLFSPKLAGRVDVLLLSFIDGLSILNRGGHLLRALGGTIILWTVIGLAIACSLQALRIPATPLNALTVLAILSLGLTIPSGPGFVGTFEFFAVFSLGLLSISRTPAMAFALVLHATQLLTTVAFGLICLWAGGLSSLFPWPLCTLAKQLSSDPNMESTGR